MLTGTNGWTARSWALFRVVLGGFLFVHFVMLGPWAGEVFVAMGTTSTSPLFPFVPSPLWWAPSAATAQALVGLGALSSLALAWGRHDRIAAAVILWVLACLLAANPLILNPALPHVGWMLLAHALTRQPPDLGTLWRDADAGADWALPRGVYAAGWTVMTLAYAYSAYTKLDAASWVDGTAMAHVLTNPLARDTMFRQVLLQHPQLLALATWGALAVEALAPVALVSRRLRPWVWGALLALQLGLWGLVDFADLTWGMLILQVWTFDPAWWRGRLAGKTALRTRTAATTERTVQPSWR